MLHPKVRQAAMSSDLSAHPELALTTTLELCRQLQRTVRSITLYGGDHPATGPAVEGLVVRYGELEASAHLAFAPDQLIVDNHEVTPLDPLLTALTNHLHALGIARMTVQTGAEAEEVEALAYFLARRPQDEAEAPRLPHFPMEGLEYVAVSSRRSVVTVSEEKARERQRQLWRALATGRLGVHEELDREAQEFLQAMMRQQGSLAELLRSLPADEEGVELDIPSLPGKMVARLLRHLGGATPSGLQDEALAADIAARLLELPAETLADTLSDEEAPRELISRGLALQRSDDLLEMMAAVVRAEGADSARLVHCIGAFLSPESRANGLLPEIRKRLHSAAEEGDGEHLAVWRRVEEIAFEQSGERYMSAAYEEQLDDFACAHFPNLSRYQGGEGLDEERLASLEPEALATDHIHLLLDLLADESDPEAFDAVVEALGERLARAVEEHDFALAALISEDLKRHCGPESTRPERMKQMIRQELGSIGLEELVDRALTEVRHVEAIWTETFHNFLSLFEHAIAPHLLDRLREEEDRRVRRTIMATLARFSGDLVPELTRRLEGAPWYYARNLVHLLGDSGSEEAVRPLTLALHHPDPRVSKEAILALRAIDSPRAIPFVIKLLTLDRGGATSEHDRVRIEAARYLARHPTSATVEALRKGVLSRRPAVATACRQLLHDLPGRDA